MMKITACIITFNEANNIGNCLASLKDVVDEIVVIDSFSTDTTVEICEGYGAKVFQHQWEGYSKAKNLAGSYASFPYILSMDADESLSLELAKSIKEVMVSPSGVYSMHRQLIYCGKTMRYGGLTNDVVTRLFPKEIQWKGDIHEKLDLAGQNVLTIPLDGKMLHYSYHNISEHVLQAVKYGTLAGETKAKSGKSYPWLALIYKPFFKFFKFYLLKGGILEGGYGAVEAIVSAFSVWVKVQTARSYKENK